MKKKLKIRIPRGVDLEKFIDELMGAVYAQYANYSIKGSEVLITIVGDPASIARTEYSVKKALSRLHTISQSTASDKARIPKSMVASVLGKPVPIDLLTSALELEGVDFSVDDEEIIVKLSIDELRRMAEELFALYQASRELFSGAARKVATLVAYTTGRGLDEVFTMALEKGIMSKGEDGRARLRVHKEKALSLLLQAD